MPKPSLREILTCSRPPPQAYTENSPRPNSIKLNLRSPSTRIGPRILLTRDRAAKSLTIPVFVVESECSSHHAGCMGILALAVGPARELFHPFANLPLR